MQNMSHPAWGAWIEITKAGSYTIPQGCRTPHGVRGLKFFGMAKSTSAMQSHPAWGAWIEIQPQR